MKPKCFPHKPFPIPTRKDKCPKILVSEKSIFNFILETGTTSFSLVLGKPARDWKTQRPFETWNLEKKNQSNTTAGISKQFRLKSIIWGKVFKKSVFQAKNIHAELNKFSELVQLLL